MSLFSSAAALAVVGVLLAIGIVVTLVLIVGRKKNDWAGDPRPPQQPNQPQQPPRSIDDSQQFREQNRPTDPPPPA